MRLFWLFNDLPFNSARQIQKPVLLTNQLVYLSSMRIINNKNQIELLSVATYYFDPCALKVYAQRWLIECFLKAIKFAGFYIQNTHFKDQLLFNNI